MRAQFAIFPYPLDACAPIFALARLHRENPPGVAKIQRLAARPIAHRAR
jgi:hypothetical protein